MDSHMSISSFFDLGYECHVFGSLLASWIRLDGIVSKILLACLPLVAHFMYMPLSLNPQARFFSLPR